MSRRPRIGIAGLGDIARLHAQGLKAHPDIELAVCRGRNPGSADVFARDFEAIVYDSWQQMLSDERVIAVDLCVPNDLHRRYTEEAATAGKHVICEKPVAMTTEDATAMVGACRTAGVELMVAHVLRFWPEYVSMRDMLQSGALGQCHAITLRRMLSLLLSVSGSQGWRQDPRRMGGAILDLQIHDIDFLLWTFGIPESVYCVGARSEDGGLNHVYTVLNYGNGPRAFIEASYMLQGDPMIFMAKAVCERGSLDYAMNLDQFDMHEMQGGDTGAKSRSAASLVCYRPGAEPEVLHHADPKVLENVFRNEMLHFTNCALSRAENDTASTADAVAAVGVVEACQESIRTGSVVSLSETAALLRD